jgi:hypothetical protein
VQQVAEDQQYLQAEAAVRAAAQRSVTGWRHSPKALLENIPEAFSVWLTTYFPHKIPEIEPWQDEPLTVLVEGERALLLVPAGTMKTTIGSELYPIWRLCQNRNYERLGLFKDDEHAKDSLRAIKLELTVNEQLIEDFGRFVPISPDEKRRAKWTEHQIDVIGRERRSRSASIRYMAWGSAGSLGYRSHTTHVDDAVTEEIAYSPEQTRQFMSKMGVNVETTLYPLDSESDWDTLGGLPMQPQIAVYGTRFAKDDPYGKLIALSKNPDMADNEHFEPYRYCVVDLIKDEETHETISRRWPWQRAMAKRAQMGDREFAMRYRNDPSDPSVQIIKEAWVRGGTIDGATYTGCRDTTITRHNIILPTHMVAIGYDPQSGSKTRFAKLGAAVMMANTPGPTDNWNPIIVDWWAGQTLPLDMEDPESQVNILVSMAKHANERGVKPVVVLESNNVQLGFKEPILDRAKARGVELTVQPSITLKQKHDRETGIQGAAIDFQNGWVKIPWGHASDEAHFKEFEDQMIAFGTSKYSDVPIAWWKARSYLYELKHRAEPVAQEVQPWMSPWMAERVANGRSRLGVHLNIVNAYEQQPEEDVDYATESG